MNRKSNPDMTNPPLIGRRNNFTESCFNSEVKLNCKSSGSLLTSTNINTEHRNNSVPHNLRVNEKWSGVNLSVDLTKRNEIENNSCGTKSPLNLNGYAKQKIHLDEKVLSLGGSMLPRNKLPHLNIHKWTILHYSPFKAVWDWIILILVIYTAIFTPYVAAFVLCESDYEQRNQRTYTDDPIVVIDLIDWNENVQNIFNLLTLLPPPQKGRNSRTRCPLTKCFEEIVRFHGINDV